MKGEFVECDKVAFYVQMDLEIFLQRQLHFMSCKWLGPDTDWRLDLIQEVT